MHFPRAFAYAQLASILALFLPVAVWAQGDSLRRIVRRDSLPNGMAIVVVENHNVPLATAEVVFRGGASVQSDELQGVPHLFEHMLFKSYRGRGVRPFGIDANEIDAAYNGATGREAVSYFLSFPAEHAGEALGLLSALVRDPEFTDEDLQRERFVVRGEIQRTHSQPQFLLADASDRLLWGAFFPRVNTGGDDLSMFSVKKDQLKGFLRTWYVPNNAALVVTGDVKADRVLSMARAAFGDWKRQGDPLAAHPVPAPPPLDSIRAVVLTADVTTVTITMSWRAPGVRSDPRGSRDAVALADVMNDEASRFHRKLVDGGAFQAVASPTMVRTTPRPSPSPVSPRRRTPAVR